MPQAQMDEATYLKQVREQYEQLPYPPRDPARELNALIFTMTSGLDRINSYHYSGKRDFSQPFEVLVAGCGTGDGVISLGTQLYGSPARITALDMSTASLAVAKGRAEARGLDNIRFVHDSLLNVKAHTEKPFDHINCLGVLHHLEAPEAGLAALESVLAPDGAMHLMLYAQYGRESVYQMQKLMRLVNGDEPNMQRKVDMCRAMLAQLPAHHGFRTFVETVQDVKQWGDSGLYDLLLHSQDVAYTVPQVYDFLSSAGLQPSHWFYGEHPKGNDLYRARGHISDPELLAQAQQLPLRDQQTVAELMDSTIARHEFYAVRNVPALPDPNDLDMVPHIDVVHGKTLAGELGQALRSLSLGQPMQVQLHGCNVLVSNTAHAGLLLMHMDGETTLRTLFEKVRAAAGNAVTDAELKREFLQLFAAFNRYDVMFVKHAGVPAYRSMDEANALRGKKA